MTIIKKVLVVGLGSIGKRHIQNLRAILPTATIAVWRHRNTNQDLGTEAKIIDTVFYSAEDALAWKPDVAVVSNPATRHVETSRLLAESGIHLFVEKPLSHTPDGVADLLQLCHQKSVKLMVGYNFRFYEPFVQIKRAIREGRIGRLMTVRAEVGQYLPDWRPGTDYRKSVSARSELGGGALLELSHEIDYIRFLAGEIAAVSAMSSQLADLEINAEDTAVLNFRLASGGLGSLHVDMADRAPTRKCRLVGTEGTILWDGIKHEVALYSAKEKVWETVYSGGSYDKNEMYLKELRHFVDCVENDKPLDVAGSDGLRTLQIVLAAKQSAESGRAILI